MKFPEMHFFSPAWKAILYALYEYLLVTSPVFIYILLEAMAENNYEFIFISPEWSIATLFLAFQGRTLYRKALTMTGKRLYETWMDLLEFSALIVVIASTINVCLSLHNNSCAAVIFRVSLFGFVSAAFILFASAGRFAAQKGTSA